MHAIRPKVRPMASTRFSILFAIVLLSLFSYRLTAGQQCTVTTAFDGDCESLLLRAIDAAEKEIRVAIYSFSRDSIAEALVSKHRSGVNVLIKMDRQQSRNKWCRNVVKKLKDSGIAMEFIELPKPAHMHNKFAIVDSSTVVTGSFNFTTLGSTASYENLVVIEDTRIATEFLAAWAQIYSRNRNTSR